MQIQTCNQIILPHENGAFTKEWLYSLNLDCFSPACDSFDDYVSLHFESVMYLRRVAVETVSVDQYELAEQSAIAPDLNRSEIIARLAWLVERARLGASVVLDSSVDTIVLFYGQSGLHSLRVICDDGVWCIAPSNRVSLNRGDQLLVFSILSPKAVL